MGDGKIGCTDMNSAELSQKNCRDYVILITGTITIFGFHIKKSLSMKPQYKDDISSIKSVLIPFNGSFQLSTYARPD
jgi:hypothetical protein